MCEHNWEVVFKNNESRCEAQSLCFGMTQICDNTNSILKLLLITNRDKYIRCYTEGEVRRTAALCVNTLLGICYRMVVVFIRITQERGRYLKFTK
jgi:hypothetical protein